MANHLEKIFIVLPHYYNKPSVFSVKTEFRCLNCMNKLKIKKIEDIIRWRKCPTCGFVFLDKQYFSVDELMEEERNKLNGQQ